MPLPIYLAMTAAEFEKNSCLPPQIAWMACHFSLYGKGITNLPNALPPGALLILNDRVPIRGHDPERICQQLLTFLERNPVFALLLDFQQPDQEEIRHLAAHLASAIGCKLAISSLYAQPGCPVFLPPCPPDLPLSEHIAPWKGWELWLDIAKSVQHLSLDAHGCHSLPFPREAQCPQPASNLHCHYGIQSHADSISFFLERKAEDLSDFLQSAENSGVTTAVGLYQELGALQ
jgi:hypothetical protein